MLEILSDSALDCLKLLPFLFLSYLAVEYMEHKMSDKSRQIIYSAGAAGPIVGGLLGMIPQCGFAAAAAGLFAGGVVSPGTLLAVFLSSSDEMLPIMVSEGVSVGIMSKIVLIKATVGILVGLLFDLVLKYLGYQRNVMTHESPICEHDHCHCGEGQSIWRSALHHTVNIAVFLFLLSFVIGLVMEQVEAKSLSQLLGGIPVLEEAVTAIIGMIPNCAASVLVTQLYLEGLLSAGALFSGLLCGAGAGLLVLYRENRKTKENLMFTGVLYVTGVAAGMIIRNFGLFSMG